MAKKTAIKLIPFPASVEFIEAMRLGIKKAGYTNRSEFIRDAIAEKFAGAHVKFSAKVAQPPRILNRRALEAKAEKAGKTAKATKAAPAAKKRAAR